MDTGRFTLDFFEQPELIVGGCYHHLMDFMIMYERCVTGTAMEGSPG